MEAITVYLIKLSNSSYNQASAKIVASKTANVMWTKYGLGIRARSSLTISKVH